MGENLLDSKTLKQRDVKIGEKSKTVGPPKDQIHAEGLISNR